MGSQSRESRKITTRVCPILAAVVVTLLGVVAPGAMAQEERLELDNGVVRATVTLNEGKLVGERLEMLDPRGAVFETTGDFLVDVVWSGWRAPGKVNNADNQCRFTAADFVVSGRRTDEDSDVTRLALSFTGPRGLGLEVSWELPDTASFVRRRIRVFDPDERSHFLHALYTLDATVRGEATVVKNGGFGQPIAVTSNGTGAFLALEWPAADNSLREHGGRLWVRCGQVMGEIVTAAGVSGESVVIALTPDKRVKHAFREYLNTIRVAPLRPYTLYNSWYDLRSAEYPRVKPHQVMNQENVLRIVRLLRENMVEKHGITLDAFVLDDGWDVYQSDWVLRPVQFPNGLAPVKSELERTNTALGIWYGPIGGYSLRKERVGWMREHGYETAGTQLWVGGPRYSELLTRRTTDMARDGVSYFKWDGYQFLANGPELGTPPGIYARRAVLHKVIEMARAVRAIDPEMFLNITSGTWLSPWWLTIADQIWMSGQDYGSADVPSISTRDSSITYRDLVLYEDFRTHDLWFPIANLMTHGVLKGTIDIQDIGKGEPLSKFADEVVFYLARGVTMHELYISPDILSEGEWRVLADALRWARDRFGVLRTTEMIGGDPNLREPYGYAHYAGSNGVLALRNPDVVDQEIRLVLDPAHGLDPAARELVLERIYPTRWVAPRLLAAGDTIRLPLAGYEAAVYELRPLDAVNGPLLAGVVFEETRRDSATRVLSLLEAGPVVSLLNSGTDVELRVEGKADADASSLVVPDPPILGSGAVSGEGGTVSARLAIAPQATLATIAVLLRPDQPLPKESEPRVEILLDGVRAEPQRVAAEGVWAYYTLNSSPGSHTLELQVRPAEGATDWVGSASLWLTGTVAVEPVRVELLATSPLPDSGPLPATGRGPAELPRSVHLGDVEVKATGAQTAKR